MYIYVHWHSCKLTTVDVLNSSSIRLTSHGILHNEYTILFPCSFYLRNFSCVDACCSSRSNFLLYSNTSEEDSVIKTATVDITAKFWMCTESFMKCYKLYRYTEKWEYVYYTCSRSPSGRGGDVCVSMSSRTRAEGLGCLYWLFQYVLLRCWSRGPHVGTHDSTWCTHRRSQYWW